MHLEPYSLGIGDRFGYEAPAQLRALQMAQAHRVAVVPVWNKSNREHSIIGTSPDHARLKADEAVRTCGWKGSYYVDADHIGIATVDRFMNSSNFFTIDVADFIGKPPARESVEAFLAQMAPLTRMLTIPGIDAPVAVTRDLLLAFAAKYLNAMEEAGRVYRRIAAAKGAGGFVPEVSVDEADVPQSPVDLLLILAALARGGVPVQTIAPKFTGAFLKGVDYVGDVDRFVREFEDDLAVVAYAVKEFGLPRTLKLSIHSGSDKFSLYPRIHEAIRARKTGLHLKTAGTTWLEEIIGLAAAGGEGLILAKDIYTAAYGRFDELCAPYRTVVDIDRRRLPNPVAVRDWNSADYMQALQHDQSCPEFNRDVRQLVHVAYKIAAEMGERFTGLLRECRRTIEANVTSNIYDRHIQPLFMGEAPGTRGRGVREAAEAG